MSGSEPSPRRPRHRGAAPEDERLFDAARGPALAAAVVDLSHLLSRGYPARSALKLVGDRHALEARQREAVLRSACSDAALARRLGRRIEASALAGRPLWIDGFNVLLTIEAGLAGAPVLLCRDGAWRDIAGVHGTYRTVEETVPALAAIAAALRALGVAGGRVLFDRPVSNSGRVAEAARDALAGSGSPWTVETADDPDAVLRASPVTVASADGAVIEAAPGWFNLVRHVLEPRAAGLRLVRLTGH